MPDMELLRKTIKESGITITALCSKSGIERATFYNRLNGNGEWTVSEMMAVSKALRLTRKEQDAIFLSRKLG